MALQNHSNARSTISGNRNRQKSLPLAILISAILCSVPAFISTVLAETPGQDQRETQTRNEIEHVIGQGRLSMSEHPPSATADSPAEDQQFENSARNPEGSVEGRSPEREDDAEARQLKAEMEQAGAVDFYFDLQVDDVLRVDKYQDIDIDSGSNRGREERNRIILKVTDANESQYRLNGFFHTYSRSPPRSGQFRRDRDFHSDFLLNRNGQYRVPTPYAMPNIQSMPSFPDRPLQPGDTWQAPALEMMDLGGVRLRIPLEVNYRYIGPEPIRDRYGNLRPTHKIEFSYRFDHREQNPRSPAARVRGQASDTFYFDAEAGIPVYATKTVTYDFSLADNRSLQSEYKIDSWYDLIRRTTTADRLEMARIIREDLAENDDIQVNHTDEGILLSIGDILFDHDSDQLTERSRSTISRIASIIAEHPEREIRVSGHTDSTGQAAYNQDLSERRARSVVRELQNQHSVDGRRMSFRGYGQEQPVADNNSRQGRAQNRRVEVLIVTE